MVSMRLTRGRQALRLVALSLLAIMGGMPAAWAQTPADPTDAPAIDALAPDQDDAPAIDALAPEQDDAPAIDALAPEQDDAPAIDALAPEQDDAPDDTLRVTVRANLPRTLTSATMTLGRQDLEAAPARNAEELLRQVPGLTLIQHGSEGKGHQFFLRGFDAVHGADLELTLGGVPLNEWSNIHGQGYIDLGVVLPEVVESMHVIKGPFALHQGLFGMAGTVDYRPGVSPQFLDGEALQSHVALTGGTTGRLRLFGRHASADGASFAAAEVMRDAGYGEQRGIERATLNASTSELRLWGGSLSTFFAAGASRFELPGTLRSADVEAGSIGFYDAYDDRGRGQSARVLGSATWQGRGVLTAGDMLRLRLDGAARDLVLFENFTGYLGDPANGDRTRQAHRTFGGGADLFYSRPLIARMSFVGGAHLRGEHVTQSERGVDADLATTSTLRALQGMHSTLGARAGLRLQPTARLRMDLGGRFDAAFLRATDTTLASPPSSADGATGQELLLALSPRASARYKPNERWTFFAAYGRGLRPPELRAFAGASAELAATFSQSHAAELGVRTFPTDWLGITLTGFATLLDREVFFDHLSATTIELPSSRRLGAEIFLDIYPTDWMHLSGDLTWVDARFTDPDFTNLNQPVPQVPTLTAGAHWVVNHASGLGGGLRFLAVAPRNLPAGARSAPLTRFDATLGYRWHHWQISLDVENLLNQHLREGEYVYASHWPQGTSGSRLPVLHQSAGPPLTARLTVSAEF
ncbi:TonB-dependent receptor [Bradymonadaceae bacterium TMQ3]|nr:TonB-dependent receptor [Bradymonadaceae bacterium TMQ3]TXC74510.1 TonB-dependent receptor [Bradymonadales bacterium TMQ1]